MHKIGSHELSIIAMRLDIHLDIGARFDVLAGVGYEEWFKDQVSFISVAARPYANMSMANAHQRQG